VKDTQYRGETRAQTILSSEIYKGGKTKVSVVTAAAAAAAVHPRPHWILD